MLDNEIKLAIDEGRYFPVNNYFIGLRDKRPDMTEGGIALPETTRVAPNWVTVVAIPKKVRFNGEWIDCPLKLGDRVFVRPMDGEKILDLHKEYQNILFPRIEAYEVDGTVIPAEGRVMIKMIPEQMETEQKELDLTPAEIEFLKSLGADTSNNQSVSIVLPDTINFQSGFTNDSGHGIVLAVNEVLDVEPDDHVYYNNESSCRVENLTFIVQAQDIFMKVEEVIEEQPAEPIKTLMTSVFEDPCQLGGG